MQGSPERSTTMRKINTRNFRLATRQTQREVNPLRAARVKTLMVLGRMF